MRAGSSKQSSEKLGPLRKFTKDAYVVKFQQVSLDELNVNSLKVKSTIMESLAKIKKKQKPITQSSPLASPLDHIVSMPEQNQVLMQTESMMLKMTQQISNTSSHVDKFIMKAKIMLTFLSDKPSADFNKKFQKLLAFSKSINLAKISKSDLQQALVKQHTLIKFQLRLVDMPTMADHFSKKTNFEYGNLAEHADRLLGLIEK